MTTTPKDTPTPTSTGGAGTPAGSARLADADFAADARSSGTLGSAVQDYIARVRGGDMGLLPAILGLVVLFVIFGSADDTFLTKLNLANLATQAGPICVLAMGLIPVLLIGEIDLSAGVAGATGAAVGALLIVDRDVPWYLAVVAALVVGAVIGTLIGQLVARLGVPSFVVTLSFFLALQGVMLFLIGEGGSVRFADPVLRGLTIKNVPNVLGWAAAVLIVAAFAATALLRHRTQVKGGLQHDPLSVVLVKVGALAVIVLGITAFLNAERSPNPSVLSITGIPWMIPVVVVLLILWTFVLGSTAFGRHLYAVGGNAEAARRAGINVRRMKAMAFVLCSMMAAISGLLAASYSGKVSPGSGGGNVLLYAVGAAVIGGASLFGGKGRAVDGVIGGVVLATVANGLPLLDKPSYINFLVLGGVLLLAASVDALSRRRRSAAGV